MKHLVTIFLIAIICCSCANTGTVNILIANKSGHDTTNVTVQVPLSEINEYLNYESRDSLILLNEKNNPVEHRWVNTPNGVSIEFNVPIIKMRSQKNFSINTSQKELSDNLFRFRTNSITVSIK